MRRILRTWRERRSSFPTGESGKSIRSSHESAMRDASVKDADRKEEREKKRREQLGSARVSLCCAIDRKPNISVPRTYT